MTKSLYWIILALILASLLSCSESSQKEQEPILTPKNPVEPFSYTFNEVEIQDDYHWIENINDEKVINWLEQQSALTESFFTQNAFDDFAKNHQFNRVANDYFGAKKIGYYYFFIVKSFLPNQDSWNIGQYNKITKDVALTPLNLQPNESIVNFSVSNDGRYIACLVKNRSSQFQWEIYDSATSHFLPLNLPVLTSETNLQWLTSNEFIYTNINTVNLANLRPTLINDQVLFDINKKPNDQNEALAATILNAEISKDQNYLIITENFGFKDGDKVWVKQLNTLSDNVFVIDNINAKFQYLANIEDRFYFLTNLSASKYRIISIDAKRPSRRDWKEVISQDKDLLLSAKLHQNEQWLLNYKSNAQNKFIISSLNGNNKRNVNVELFGNLSIVSQNEYSLLPDKNNAPILNWSSPVSLGQNFSLDLSTSELNSIFADNSEDFQTNLGLITSSYNSQVHFFRSHDGSRVPITLISKSKLIRNMPIIMMSNDGDGGIFNKRYNPIFQQFIEAGGVIALVHARGGGVYGDSWYQAALGDKRFKVVEDLVAAQNWMFDKSYTTPEKLALYSSVKNSASFAQYLIHPESDLAAAVFEGGNLNLISKAKNLDDSKSSQQWKTIYGYSNSKRATANLLDADPFSNIRAKTYPSVLIVSDNNEIDDLKFLAKLQNHQAGNKPILWLESVSVNFTQKIEFFLKRQLNL
ncbi:MAG: S9 family peptidase [Gammaproteobacteria bacterium]|nr:S9 family peptidase [Gammaproteobacteria bacterium]